MELLRASLDLPIRADLTFSQVNILRAQWSEEGKKYSCMHEFYQPIVVSCIHFVFVTILCSYLTIRESVDSLCRHGAYMPILRIS